MITFNRIFYGHGHKFIYDFQTMKYHLEQAGFYRISKVDFKLRQNSDLLIDNEHRKVESLYIEAHK